VSKTHTIGWSFTRTNVRVMLSSSLTQNLTRREHIFSSSASACFFLRPLKTSIYLSLVRHRLTHAQHATPHNLPPASQQTSSRPRLARPLYRSARKPRPKPIHQRANEQRTLPRVSEQSRFAFQRVTRNVQRCKRLERDVNSRVKAASISHRPFPCDEIPEDGRIKRRLCRSIATRW